jgi:hypothetical protein
MAIANVRSYDEFVDFITSSPTLEQIAQFRLSAATKRQISDLLHANQTRQLTAEEQAELDEYLRVEHLMRKVKIRAFEKLG